MEDPNVKPSHHHISLHSTHIIAHSTAQHKYRLVLHHTHIYTEQQPNPQHVRVHLPLPSLAQTTSTRHPPPDLKILLSSHRRPVTPPLPSYTESSPLYHSPYITLPIYHLLPHHHHQKPTCQPSRPAETGTTHKSPQVTPLMYRRDIHLPTRCQGGRVRGGTSVHMEPHPPLASSDRMAEGGGRGGWCRAMKWGRGLLCGTGGVSVWALGVWAV